MNYRTKSGREILKNRIDAYFAECDRLNEGKAKAEKPYTLSGLLYSLGLSSDELDELYVGCRRLRPIIGSAKRKIEAYIEENALCGRLAATAAINSLKVNFGRSDKELTEKFGGGLGFEVVLSDDAEELAE